MPKEITQFTQQLNGQTKAIESMLPVGMDSRRFMRTVVNTISTHPQSDKLLRADRQSLFNSCQKAAGDGLLIDGREATLVVFHDRKSNTDRVSYIPMVQGLVKLARNSGEISNIIAELVYSKDDFQYRPGVDTQPIHDPQWFGDRGKPIGVYAVVTTKDNEKIVSVMPEKRIYSIAGTGRNADQYSPTKGANFEEWWKKTAIKNVLKYSPKSTYLESAISSDNKSTGTTYEVPEYQESPEAEKDVTPPPPSDEEIKAAIAKARKSIASAKTKEQLLKLQKTISELPLDDQEALVIEWNEKAVKLKVAEDKAKAKAKPAKTYGPEEHHIVEPETGEIVGDIA